MSRLLWKNGMNPFWEHWRSPLRDLPTEEGCRFVRIDSDRPWWCPAKPPDPGYQLPSLLRQEVPSHFSPRFWPTSLGIRRPFGPWKKTASGNGLWDRTWQVKDLNAQVQKMRGNISSPHIRHWWHWQKVSCKQFDFVVPLRLPWVWKDWNEVEQCLCSLHSILRSPGKAYYNPWIFQQDPQTSSKLASWNHLKKEVCEHTANPHSQLKLTVEWPLQCARGTTTTLQVWARDWWCSFLVWGDFFFRSLFCRWSQRQLLLIAFLIWWTCHYMGHKPNSLV